MSEDFTLPPKIIEAFKLCKWAHENNLTLNCVADELGVDENWLKPRLEAIALIVLKRTGKELKIPPIGIRRENDFAELVASQTMEHGRGEIPVKLPVKGEHKIATDAKTAKRMVRAARLSDLIGDV